MPLACRANAPEGVVVASDLAAALDVAEAYETVDKVFVIGGATVYSQALALPSCSQIYLTVVRHPFECDTTMPPVDEAVFALDQAYTDHIVEGDVKYEYQLYNRV